MEEVKRKKRKKSSFTSKLFLHTHKDRVASCHLCIIHKTKHIIMVMLTEMYAWEQARWRNKLKKLNSVLEIVNFSIEGEVNDEYLLSQQAAMEGMQTFAQRMEEMWQSKKELLKRDIPHWDFNTRYRIKIEGQPVGELIACSQLVSQNYATEAINVQDYRNSKLPHALLEPPYSLNIKFDAEFGSEQYYAAKSSKFTNLYREFVNEFLQFADYQEDNFVVYEWSNDWSNFFDAGKEWWGCYYWTIYNKQNHTIIVLGASATD